MFVLIVVLQTPSGRKFRFHQPNAFKASYLTRISLLIGFIVVNTRNLTLNIYCKWCFGGTFDIILIFLMSLVNLSPPPPPILSLVLFSFTIILRRAFPYSTRGLGVYV